MQYDDAFTLQHIEAVHIVNFNYMAGMVPFVQKLIKDVSRRYDVISQFVFFILFLIRYTCSAF